MPSKIIPVSNEELLARFGVTDRRLDKIDKTLESVANSLVEVVRLEERHASMLDKIEVMQTQVTDIDKRVGVVEVKVPSLMETRKWVMQGILGVLTLVVVAVVGLVIVKPTVEVRVVPVPAAMIPPPTAPVFVQ